jgi:hypothetical protein
LTVAIAPDEMPLENLQNFIEVLGVRTIDLGLVLQSKRLARLLEEISLLAKLACVEC